MVLLGGRCAPVQCRCTAAPTLLHPALHAPATRATPQAIGRICDISQDLLGATVLAWGEAVPELVATLSLARQGQVRSQQQGGQACLAVCGAPRTVSPQAGATCG